MSFIRLNKRGENLSPDFSKSFSVWANWESPDPRQEINLFGQMIPPFRICNESVQWNRRQLLQDSRYKWSRKTRNLLLLLIISKWDEIIEIRQRNFPTFWDKSLQIKWISFLKNRHWFWHKRSKYNNLSNLKKTTWIFSCLLLMWL